MSHEPRRETFDKLYGDADADDEILTEADSMRAHEEEMARITKEREVALAKVRAKEREHRRNIFIAVVAIVLGVVLILGLCYGCTETARECTAGGGTWDPGAIECVVPGDDR